MKALIFFFLAYSFVSFTVMAFHSTENVQVNVKYCPNMVLSQNIFYVLNDFHQFSSFKILCM